jgi:hypothetical protein
VRRKGKSKTPEAEEPSEKELAPGVKFGTVAREWRCHWSDKKALSEC